MTMIVWINLRLVIKIIIYSKYDVIFTKIINIILILNVYILCLHQIKFNTILGLLLIISFELLFYFMNNINFTTIITINSYFL